MTLSPGLRKLALTAHVTASVGWLGAVAGTFGLGVAILTSRDVETVRAAYLALELGAWYVLVPFAFASLLTGVVQSVGTPWGLFRHYWVLAKLLMNVFATIVLLLYTQTLGHLADIAETSAAGDPASLRDASPALHAGTAVLLLVVATVLAVYKPQGMTPYGRRKLDERRLLAGS